MRGGALRALYSRESSQQYTRMIIKGMLKFGSEIVKEDPEGKMKRWRERGQEEEEGGWGGLGVKPMFTNGKGQIMSK